MAKESYYFPLYYKRLLTSTIGWKDDEFGAYVRLLIHQFDNGSIPSDMDEIVRIAPSAKKHWKLLSKKFKPDGKGNLVNEVMEDVKKESIERSERARENGKKRKPTAKLQLSQSDTSGLDLGNPESSYLITNNQEPITKRNRETGLSTKIFDAESALLENQIELERICVITGKSITQAKESLHKYHLYLQEKEQYPKSRLAIFAGFEKWLMNEKTVQQSTEGNPLRKLIV